MRALLVGAAGCLAIGAGVPYSNMLVQGSRIAAYFSTPAAIILFILGQFVTAGLWLVIDHFSGTRVNAVMSF